MATLSELYADALNLEDSALWKDLVSALERSRQERIEALIKHAEVSTDQNVARLAWSLKTDSFILDRINQVKREFELQTRPPGAGEAADEQHYPNYDTPDIAGTGEQWS